MGWTCCCLHSAQFPGLGAAVPVMNRCTPRLGNAPVNCHTCSWVSDCSVPTPSVRYMCGTSFGETIAVLAYTLGLCRPVGISICSVRTCIVLDQSMRTRVQLPPGHIPFQEWYNAREAWQRTVRHFPQGLSMTSANISDVWIGLVPVKWARVN